jgi:hypothetical protein
VGFKIIILTIQDTAWWPSGKKKLYQGDLFQTGRISTPLQLKRAKCFIAETANPTGGKTNKNSEEFKV